MNENHRRALALIVLSLTCSVAAPASRGTSPRSLPELKRQVIASKLDLLLKDMGDLQAYVSGVDDNGITVKTFDEQTACVTLPPPTLMKAGVDSAELVQLERSLELLNHALERGDPPPLRGVQAACLDQPRPGGSLPKLTPSEIQQNMTRMLARMGDLGAYLGDVGQDGAIVIKTFGFRHRCTTLPPPLEPGQSMNKNTFTPLENALGVVNAARLANSKGPVPMKTMRAPCLGQAASHPGAPDVRR